MGKDVMIKLNHVQKKYPDFSMDCSLTVYPGMITGLIGANGEGKSTTFKLILGLIGKEAGEMEVLGKKRECSNDGKQPEKADREPRTVCRGEGKAGRSYLRVSTGAAAEKAAAGGAAEGTGCVPGRRRAVWHAPSDRCIPGPARGNPPPLGGKQKEYGCVISWKVRRSPLPRQMPGQFT